ncbi:MAG: AIR synthase-related protein, partial [Elusimicrobiota bacterium]
MPSKLSLLDCLETISRERLLSLSAEEIRGIRRYFFSLRRDPTMAEIEMIAQAWSEHTRHKTLRAGFKIHESGSRDGKRKTYKNLLEETVFAATARLKKPWVLSAFKDNAGIVAFDRQWALAIKVETHNHPSALHPYGGASTGMGGVIRDVLGAGLGARPIAGIDIFCVAPTKGAGERGSGGVGDGLHGHPVLDGLVAGVRDYGNRMGIPTVAGLVYFDEVFDGLPLVFAGTLGLIPRNRVRKTGPQAGDWAYLIGGKTGRDGIHGATFSSQELTLEDPIGVVQIGNPILEKKVLDFFMEARAAGLYNSVTDLGAGGIACAIWELAVSSLERENRRLGVQVELDGVAFKEPGMEGWEILVSESQERMMISAPTSKKKAIEEMLNRFELDFACLGRFVRGGKVQISFQNQTLVDLPLRFLKEHPKKSFELRIEGRES